ncbi:MAG: four helix bundle protein [Clostridia bacterium]|nr:four helix bundle protein [Clostridia bacterium]
MGALTEQALEFSVRILKLKKFLFEKCNDSIVSGQIARSGTSIGANINEANYAQSKADFISKMQIALKETSETEYWINVLYKSGYITSTMYNSLIKDCLSIKRMLISSIKTSKSINTK